MNLLYHRMGLQPDYHRLLPSSTLSEGYIIYSGPRIILTSADKGITWKIQNSDDWPELNNIVWSGSQLVIVGGNTNKPGIILTSSNGSTWTIQAPGTWPQLIDVAWSGHLLAAVGVNGTILTSLDGSTWTSQKFPVQNGSPPDLFGIAWLGSHFVAVG